ncbi:phosphatidylinositol 4-kinase B [Nematocida sp. AWRm77]|nr:phosphatidylinositol 4-kinase B [Nematocida sp. AWRm77]
MAQERRAWLTHVFDSEYFVFWMAVKCLFRYQEKGVHQYLCFKILQTRKDEVLFYFPQLFHLMLMEQGCAWNRPIFQMLYGVCRVNKHLALVLGMYSLSAVQSFSVQDPRYALCVEIAEIMAQVRPAGKVKKCRVYTYLSVYGRYLRVTYGSKVGLSPTPEDQVVQQRAFYSLPEKRTPRARKHVHSAESVLSALLSGVVSVFGSEQQAFLLSTADVYRGRRSKTEQEVKESLKRSTTALGRNTKEAQFITKLNGISDSLLSIPKPMRAQALATELNLINLYLPEDICLSLLCGGVHTSVLKVCAPFSKVLDSAARAPFLLVFETTSKITAARERKSLPIHLVCTDGADAEKKEQRKAVAKEAVLKAALKILGGLKELDGNLHVDIDILAIKTRVMKKIYDMHNPIPVLAPKKPVGHREEWSTLQREVRETSPYKGFPSWQVQSLIVKTGSDMKQEQLTTQILKTIKGIWKADALNIFIQNYKVLVTGHRSGLIETITGVRSIHQIKKSLKEKGKDLSLLSYFAEEWADTLEEARENFFRSLVGYSLVSYILQIKDRHNGNILIDEKGRMLHIDFGFVLGAHPGFYSVESAPFKFSVEYAEVVGPERMAKFNEEFLKGFLSLRKHMDHIITLVESIALSNTIPSIVPAATEALRNRFGPGMTEDEFIVHIADVVARGMKNVFTDIYDSFQYYTQGYCK